METQELIEKCRVEAITRAKADAVDVTETMKPGDEFRQGDVYISRLNELPKKMDLMPVASARQLAPGSSQGSRHCLSTLEGVEMWRRVDATALQGPVFECKSPLTVEHPEHGHVRLPAGVYAIEYQRQYADELRAVAD